MDVLKKVQKHLRTGKIEYVLVDFFDTLVHRDLGKAERCALAADRICSAYGIADAYAQAVLRIRIESEAFAERAFGRAYTYRQVTDEMLRRMKHANLIAQDTDGLIELNDLGNVEDVETLQTGQTIIYNAATQQYEMFDLTGALTAIGDRITLLEGRVSDVEADIVNIKADLVTLNTKIAQLTQLVGTFNLRLSNIEDAIYNWENDKVTKIPRGTINITSGGPNSDYIIQSREKDQDNDLDFQ